VIKAKKIHPNEPALLAALDKTPCKIQTPLGFSAINTELKRSDADTIALNQLTNRKISLRSEGTKKETIRGKAVNRIKGNVMNHQNLDFESVAFVCSQKKN